MSQPMTRPETPAPSVIEVFNPATRAKVGEVPIHGRAEVAAAVEAARVAQREWAARSFRERATLLYRYRDVLIDNKERIADVLTAETGKPRGGSIAARSGRAPRP